MDAGEHRRYRRSRLSQQSQYRSYRCCTDAYPVGSSCSPINTGFQRENRTLNRTECRCSSWFGPHLRSCCNQPALPLVTLVEGGDHADENQLVTGDKSAFSKLLMAGNVARQPSCRGRQGARRPAATRDAKKSVRDWRQDLLQGLARGRRASRHPHSRLVSRCIEQMFQIFPVQA